MLKDPETNCHVSIAVLKNCLPRAVQHWMAIAFLFILLHHPWVSHPRSRWGKQRMKLLSVLCYVQHHGSL